MKNPKTNNKVRIARYISAMGTASKGEIAKSLHMSMPTVLQNVKELSELGVVTEEGEYASTGGRKAKALSVSREAGASVGVDITNHHITFVLVNTRKELTSSKRIFRTYVRDRAYMQALKEDIFQFIEDSGLLPEKILGIGFSLPGIVDQKKSLLLRSHTLKVKNVSFRELGGSLGYPFILKNDANSAAEAELGKKRSHAVYLSLSDTVGGAVYMEERLYEGDNLKSAEFGHMIIEREGRRCYCGKRGCLDAYCRAGILKESAGAGLEEFFRLLREGDAHAGSVWEEYLDSVAVAVSNLRMVFDCDIILGGYVGGYLEEYMPRLSEKVKQYNNFDEDTKYLHTGKYGLEASAYGAALYFIDGFFERL